jgi:membrane-associated phospholipid phosphatase
MKFLKPVLLVTALAMYALHCNAQLTDTTNNNSPGKNILIKPVAAGVAESKKAFPIKSFIVPAIFFMYGMGAIENNNLKNINLEFKEEIFTEHPHNKAHIDNYLQFAPAVMVYSLNAAGVKGRHNFIDRSMIYLTSNIILNTSVYSIKKISHQLRPDGSAKTSFPSGHTAEAFASAEFLRMEYKDVSAWYGVAGYAIAATTGYLRIYNNKHWFGDVVAGAGVGIASTQLSYWLYPKMKKLLFKNKNTGTVVMPAYQNHTFGVSMVTQF